MSNESPFASFEEACDRANLTVDQSTKLREYLGPVEQERVRLYGLPWTMSWSISRSILGRIASSLILWDRNSVTGPKRRFVKQMFGPHVEPPARAVREDGFRIARRSQEFYSKLFEMEVISLLLVNGYQVELLDEAGPECIATCERVSLAVEAKMLDTDSLLDTVFRFPPSLTREYCDDSVADPTLVRAPEEQMRLAEQFFRNLDRAVQQCLVPSIDVAVVFIKVGWPLGDLDLAAGFAQRAAEWTASRYDRFAGVVVVDPGRAKLIPNQGCSGLLEDLFPSASPADLAGLLPAENLSRPDP